MGETTEYAVKMHHVTKTFGKVVANKDVDLELKNGEILALLGENGSGKTTLMNMLSGIYFPDHGEISIHGTPVTIRSPRDAFGLGIGMIHQHFKLVDVLTAAENIVLGLDGKAVLNRKEVNKKVAEIASRYGFEIDPGKKIYNMAVSEKQTVEILKVLYRGADILILDEPTAVLTPQETEKLFAVLRNMKKDGKSIIIITHKLHEVLAISDRVAILRKGEYIGAVETAKTNQAELTEMMVGRPVSLEIDRPKQERSIERLQVIDLTCLNGEGVKALDNVSFSAYGGEILGVAGIAGSGQKELCEAIAGLYPAIGGSVLYAGEHNGEPIKERILGLKPDEIVKKGISMAFVPEDRLGMGLVAGMDMTDNVMLRSYKDKKGLFVDRKTPKAVAEQLIEELEKKGVTVDDIPTYDTLYETPGAVDEKAEFDTGTVDYAVFTSASTVRGFAQAVKGIDFSKVKAVCIGRQTKAAADELGMETYMAEQATMDSVVSCVEKLCRER